MELLEILFDPLPHDPIIENKLPHWRSTHDPDQPWTPASISVCMLPSKPWAKHGPCISFGKRLVDGETIYNRKIRAWGPDTESMRAATQRLCAIWATDENLYSRKV